MQIDQFNSLNNNDFRIINNITILKRQLPCNGEYILNGYIKENVQKIHKNISRIFCRLLNIHSDKVVLQIYNFCKSFSEFTEQPESVHILAIIYLYRFVNCSNEKINQSNWKRLLFYSYMFTVKYLEEEHISSEYIIETWCSLFKEQFDIKLMNMFEISMITNKNFRIHVPIELYNIVNHLVNC